MLRSAVLSLAALGGLLAFGPAKAFVDMKSEYAANVVLSRTQSIGPGGTVAGRTITSAANFPSPGGGTVAGRVAVTFTARAAITAAARMLPVIAAGSALYEIYKALRYKQTADGPVHDPGVPQQLLPSYRCNINSLASGWTDSAGSACQSVVALLNADAGWEIAGACDHRITYSLGTFNAEGIGTYRLVRSHEYRQRNDNPCPGNWEDYGILSWQMQPAMRCEFGDPSPADTLCRSSDQPDQGYTQPKTPDDVGADWDKNKDKPGMPPFDEAAAADAVRQAYERTQAGAGPMPAVNQPHVIVEPYPATVPGGVSTTTRDDGWVTETATKWDIRPAFQAPRNPGRSNWEKTTTETTRNGNGDIVETKTRVDKPDVGSESKTCEGASDTVMCASLGEVEDKELEQKEVSVAITPMDGWGGGGGDCPAPPTVTVAGRSMTLDNSLFCKFFAWMKPLLLAVAWLIAAGTVLGGFKA